MEFNPEQFIPLLIVVSLAFIVPLTLARFKRLRLPIVVGEILAGVIIGRSGFQLVSPDEPILVFLAEFGFVFLMFLSGMEIDFSSLNFSRPRAQRSRDEHRLGPLAIALISFAVTLAISFAIGFLLLKTGLVKNMWMMGLILSTTSLGVVVPVLKETDLISSRFGQAVLLGALVADFVTMFLITVLVAILSHGITFDILLIGILFLVFFLLARFGIIHVQGGPIRQRIEELSHATAQIKIRAAFTLMLVFVVLSSALGTEVILGAFLAGALLALSVTPADSHVIHDLETIGYGFLIPIFFIHVGINFDLSVLFSSTEAILLVPILLGSAILIKLIAALVFRFSFTWRETWSAGVLLSSRLSLIIAASAIGARLNVIKPEVNAATILVAILTVTLCPLIFSQLIAPCKEGAQCNKIIIAGAGELGMQVAAQLRDHNEPVLVIDPDPARVERARQNGFESHLIAPDHSSPAVDAVFKNAKTLVATFAETEKNWRYCQLARTTYGLKNVVSQVFNPGELARFEQLGVTTMNAALDRASLLVMLARSPATFDLMIRTDDNKEVCEVEVVNPSYIGRSLRQLSLPGDVLVLALRRNGDLIVPHGDTRIEDRDSLTLVGSLEWIFIAREMFLEEA